MPVHRHRTRRSAILAAAFVAAAQQAYSASTSIYRLYDIMLSTVEELYRLYDIILSIVDEQQYRTHGMDTQLGIDFGNEHRESTKQ